MKNYYISIMIFSILLIVVFILLGMNNVLGPFSVTTGVAMSIAGIIGAWIDMKDRN